MKKSKIILIFIGLIGLLAGCDATKENDNNNEFTQEETNNVEIVCPEDSFKRNDKCYKYEFIDAQTKTICPTGYSLSNGVCTKQVVRKASKEEFCPEGSSLIDGSCILRQKGNIIWKWICPEGYLQDGDTSLCLWPEDRNEPLTTWACPVPQSISNRNCKYSKQENGYNLYVCSTTESPTCGAVLYSYTMSFNSTTQAAEYMLCMGKGGSPSGNVCTVYSYSAAQKYGVGCPSYLWEFNNACYALTNSVSAKETKFCEEGYTLDPQSGCYKNVVLDKNVRYNCSDNEVVEGESCVSYLTQNPTYVKECPSGYDLNDNDCVKTEEVDPLEINNLE